MCSKCNGILDDNKPIVQEAEKKKKNKKQQSEAGSEFIRDNFR